MPTLPEPVPRQFIPTASTLGLARWPAEPNLKGARWIGETGRRTVRVNVRETSGHSLVARIYLGCFWDGPVELTSRGFAVVGRTHCRFVGRVAHSRPFHA